MTTYQLLQMLPERREAGRGVGELIEEIGPDVAWVKLTAVLRHERYTARLQRRQDWLQWRSTIANGRVTRAGILESVIMMSQAGMIDVDEARQILNDAGGP